MTQDKELIESLLTEAAERLGVLADIANEAGYYTSEDAAYQLQSRIRLALGFAPEA